MIKQVHIMKADFLDAHERHWHDAELLFMAERSANADHLYGLAAECGLKRLMIAFGMPVDTTTGSPDDHSDRVHVMESRRPGNAWERYESYRSGMGASSYVLPEANPFSDWEISQRYGHQSNFTHQCVELHRIGAKMVHDLIVRAIREGRVT